MDLPLSPVGYAEEDEDTAPLSPEWLHDALEEEEVQAAHAPAFRNTGDGVREDNKLSERLSLTLREGSTVASDLEKLSDDLESARECSKFLSRRIVACEACLTKVPVRRLF